MSWPPHLPIPLTGSAHYLRVKFLPNLLKPLTVNQFTFDSSFDAARRIPKELLDYHYKNVFFDAVTIHKCTVT